MYAETSEMSFDSGSSEISPDSAAEGLIGAEIERCIELACSRIPPLWPLKHFVAVNPFFGLMDHSFQDASDTLARVIGTTLYMPRSYYLEQLESGRITDQDIEQAIHACGSAKTLDQVRHELYLPAPMPKMGMASVSEVLDKVEGGIWTRFVMERISLHCAAYFDLGQALFAYPWKGRTLYQSWLKAASIDNSPAMMGLAQFKKDAAKLPADPRAAIAWAVSQLGIPEVAVERYLHAALLGIGGWASWARYLRWQAELKGGQDDSMIDLLAIRLAWDVLLFREKRSAALVARWRDMLASSMRAPSLKRKASAELDRIMLSAMEIGFQRSVVSSLDASSGSTTARVRPSVQAAFCIDVRSEVFRRALETVAPSAQTIGFAGFFGIFIEYVPLGASCGNSHVPVIFNPAYRIFEEVRGGDCAAEENSRRMRIGLSKAWKIFKLSASSCFSFVESAGLLYVVKLLTDSFGWSRPVPDPLKQGLDKSTLGRIGPSLAQRPGMPDSGIPEADRLGHAERILRAMSMTDNFARLVLLAGHGSSTVNNPHATGLDCGACAGQTGEASARVVAALLNDPEVRRGLGTRGIEIPDDTWFIGGLHDTTTDELTLFDAESVPQALSEDLAQLRQWLEQAGDLTRMQRSAMLGISGLSDRGVESDVRRRSRDWSEVRPEWALAGNAAFIAAPRSRTAGADLGGRAFLHEYDWSEDEGFKILELIMTAPMVVGNWINMQYYGSVVDNLHFGSGNKVLHNIVGGAIGVLEGNGGDLRVGLPMQSLHDGKKWVHEPIRLSVFIEAPKEAIDGIIGRHEIVKNLVGNAWIHLFQIDSPTGRISKWHPDSRWTKPVFDEQADGLHATV
jgi:uncharacterized protein YbcC (UPF0753/DUF2309 family)